MMERVGQLNILKVWVQVLQKSLNNILKRKKW